jgi:hypothetical protein
MIKTLTYPTIWLKNYAKIKILKQFNQFLMRASSLQIYKTSH